jgi:hypothetical protein
MTNAYDAADLGRPSDPKLTVYSDSSKTMYRIAELNVAVSRGGKILSSCGDGFRVSSCVPPDISVCLSAEFLLGLQEKYSYIPVDKWAYETAGLMFAKKLVEFEGFILTASAILMEGEAFLFLAPKEMGLQTYAAFWKKHFGSDRAEVIISDKLAVRWKNGRYCAFFTPWSSHTEKGGSNGVPVRAVALAERSKKNWMYSLNKAESLSCMLQYVQAFSETDYMNKLLEQLSLFYSWVPIYKAGCQANGSSVAAAYSKMCGVGKFQSSDVRRKPGVSS